MKTLYSLLPLFVFTAPIQAEIIYVDNDATGMNDVSSWTDAHSFLQDALAGAVSGDEIWIAEGTYYPDDGVGLKSMADFLEQK